MAISLAVGENLVLKRDLELADESPLLVADCPSISVTLVQNEVVIQSYTYPSSTLRLGGTTSQIVLEIVTSVSAKLKPGFPAKVVWDISRPNTDYIVEEFQREKKAEVELIMITE